MNPEDRMKLLRDPDQWNVRLSARAGVFPSRRISPLFLSIATVATVAIVGVILFAVFGASIRAIRDPNLPPASPSPTADAVVQPEQVFGGDCANVFTDDQLASFGDFAAVEVSKPDYFPNDDDDTFTLAQVGGIDCSWTGDDGVIGVALFVADAAPAVDDETCGAGYSEGTTGDNFCGIQQETNGIRITGGITAPDPATAASLSPKIIAAFDTAAASVPAPVSAAAAGAWTNPVDCPALDASIDIESALGAGLAYQPDVGGDTGPYLALRPLENELLGLSCYWAAPDSASWANVQVHGGGAWNEASLAKLTTATAVGVPNVDAAYLETDTPNGSLLHIFDGPNWLIMSTFPDDLASMTTAAVTLVDALNAAKTPDAAASGTERPAQVFDGDCATVFSNAELTDLVGTPMAPQDFGQLEISPYGGLITDAAAATAGGLICAWSGDGSPGVPPLVTLGFFYESTIDPVPETDCGDPYSEGMDGDACTVEHVSSGIRMSGGVGLDATGGSRARTVVDGLIDLFEQRAADESSVAPSAPAGAWSNPIDCAALDASIDASGLYGEQMTFVANGFGGGNGPIKAEWSLLQGGNSLNCYWTAGSDSTLVKLGLLGGGAWIEDAIVDAGGSEVTIDGVDHAYVIEGKDTDSRERTLYAIDGPNVVAVGVGDDESARYPFVTGIIAALNGDGAPASPETPVSTTPKITDTGLGDLVIGKPVPADTKLVEWTKGQCGNADQSAWVPTGETWKGLQNTFIVATEGNTKNGVITSILILSPEFSTETGIHTGSTRDDLTGAYSKFDGTYLKASNDTDLYVIENDVAQTNFEVVRPGAEPVNDQIDVKDDAVVWIIVEDASRKAKSIGNQGLC